MGKNPSRESRLVDRFTPKRGSPREQRTPIGTEIYIPNYSGIPESGGGSGDMLKSVYDPANIAQQVVGTTATQTLTNKSLTKSQITDYQGYTLLGFVSASSSPADATTYYFGLGENILSTVSLAHQRIYIPRAGTIKVVNFTSYVGGALATTEALTVHLRLNNTTDTLVTNTMTMDSRNNLGTNSSLNISVAAGDYIELKVLTPTWVTNPTGARFYFWVYIE